MSLLVHKCLDFYRTSNHMYLEMEVRLTCSDMAPIVGGRFSPSSCFLEYKCQRKSFTLTVAESYREQMNRSKSIKASDGSNSVTFA